MRFEGARSRAERVRQSRVRVRLALLPRAQLHRSPALLLLAAASAVRACTCHTHLLPSAAAHWAPSYPNRWTHTIKTSNYCLPCQ